MYIVPAPSNSGTPFKEAGFRGLPALRAEMSTFFFLARQKSPHTASKATKSDNISRVIARRSPAAAASPPTPEPGAAAASDCEEERRRRLADSAEGRSRGRRPAARAPALGGLVGSLRRADRAPRAPPAAAARACCIGRGGARQSILNLTVSAPCSPATPQHGRLSTPCSPA